MIAELRSKIVSASALIREVQGLVDIEGAVDTLRHVLEWICSAHSVGPEDLSWAHSLRRAANLLKHVQLPDPQFVCPQHPFAQVHIKSRVYRVGDPDEEGTVFDRETEAVSTYGVCSTCFREVWNETTTSRMVRKRIQDVMTQARAALIDAACVIESAIRSTLAAMEAERDARFVREALTRLGLDPSGGEEALLAWATAPERHDALRWQLDPIDGCFGDIRNLRGAAARVAELVVTGSWDRMPERLHTTP
jgi:hypothetical protein